MELSSEKALDKSIETDKAGKIQKAASPIDGQNPLRSNVLDSLKLDQAIRLAKKIAKAGSAEESKHIYSDILARFPKNKRALDGIKSLSGGFIGKASKVKEPSQAQQQHLINLYQHGQLQLALDNSKQLLVQFPHSLILYNIQGAINAMLGNFNAAIDSYKQALKIKPDYAEAYCNIGNALQEKGELNAAINNYEKALLITPNYPEVRHILASLTGETTRSAPRAYVEKLFDSCAFKFERSLVDDLEYQTPKILSEMIVANHFNGSVGSVLDLGCGTGLAGAELRRFCSNLEGLDLSKLMIEEARKKNIYDRLTHSDIFDYLATEALDFNHFVATDVFIYLGEVSDLFRLIKSRNQRNGSLSFSTEHTEKPGFTLETTGRFSHSKTYIESLCKTFDFRISRFEKTNLRKEKGEFINGALYLLDF